MRRHGGPVEMKILVADDSVTMRKILQMTFAGVQRAEVVTVSSGKEAIEAARKLKPDVILADLSMPSPDGYDVAGAVKADPSLSATAVIVLASNQHPYDAARGKAAGVDDHISKPFETQTLLDKVTAAVSRPRAAASPPAGPGATQGRSAPPFRRTGIKSTIAFGAPPIPPPGGAKPAAASGARAPSPPSGTPSSPPSVPALELVPEPGIDLPEPPKPAASPKPAAASPKPAAAPPKPAAASPKPAAAPPKPAAAPPKPAAAPPLDGGFEANLRSLGLSEEQVQGVLQLTREAVERVVWEVVPDLAETLIKEEIRRLTAE